MTTDEAIAVLTLMGCQAYIGSPAPHFFVPVGVRVDGRRWLYSEHDGCWVWDSYIPEQRISVELAAVTHPERLVIALGEFSGNPYFKLENRA